VVSVASNASVGSPVTVSATASGGGLAANVTAQDAISIMSLPVISWPTPAAIAFGTLLSNVQLNATANVPGSFTYSPAAGALPHAGAQALAVTFTPTDTTDYATAAATVSLTVNQVTPAISWPTPSAIPYGTALSAAQLNATSPVAGTFTYSPAAGAVLHAG